MPEPRMAITTYLRVGDAGLSPIADVESISGRREYLEGRIVVRVEYRDTFTVVLRDDIDFLWPFLGQSIAAYRDAGVAEQTTSFGETLRIVREKQGSRTTLEVTGADGTNHRVSVDEAALLAEFARAGRDASTHLVRLVGSDGGLRDSALKIDAR